MRATVSETLITNSDAFRRWGGRVPILLGAAGHRRIESTDARLADAIRDQCVRLRKRYTHSPFVILSSLAEGADRLVARVAMKELSAELIAVLPMPPKEYERDFHTAELKAEFRGFLSRALFVKEAPVPQGGASWTVEGEARNRQYARAGAIVADHAQVLFAIWDGKPARGTGGTGDQVAWFQRGGTPSEYSLYTNAMSLYDPVEPGLLIRIDPVSKEVLRTECPASPAGKGDRIQSPIRQILTRMDKYNRDVTSLSIDDCQRRFPGSQNNAKGRQVHGYRSYLPRLGQSISILCKSGAKSRRHNLCLGACRCRCFQLGQQ